MMDYSEYLMESDDEALRLDLKTDSRVVEKQALWAGMKPGMRVADLGCGSGKTTFCLNKLVQPDGETFGIDISAQRLKYAKQHYDDKGLEYKLKDIRKPLAELGEFEFIWVRFVLEYYRTNGYEIVKNIYKILKPGGIICLIDLDHNCLNHYGYSQRLEKALNKIMISAEKHANFDPYAGRKLYSYLYDLGCSDINVSMSHHHLIFGELNEIDAFNWTKKVIAAGKKSGYQFDEYQGGFEEFFEEFKHFFNDPRRFTYTPVICCRGCKSKKNLGASPQLERWNAGIVE